MKVKMSLSTFIVLIVFVFICIMVGFVTGMAVSGYYFYEKGKQDMFNRFLISEPPIEEYEKYEGADISPRGDL